MNSKQIHRQFYGKFDKCSWLDKDEQPAKREKDIYRLPIDAENLDKALLTNIITQFLGNDEVYLIITSGKAFLIKPDLIFDEILPYIKKQQIGIANQAMNKLIYIGTYNSVRNLKKAIVKDYPKTREKQPNTPIKIEFYANMYETKFEKVPRAVEDYFEQLEQLLNKDYGGVIEHLWIALVLREGVEPYTMRVQKRVSLGNPFNVSGFFATEHYFYNVASYDVKPDFEKLKTLTDKKEICSYIFKLLYQSFDILEKKSKSLGNFNHQQFKQDFLMGCQSLGFDNIGE